jgi:hypothetical protein
VESGSVRGVRATVLVVLAFLPLAGCADEAAEPFAPHSFQALYSPVGSRDVGFELTLDPAKPLTDRDLAPRQAYVLTVNVAGRVVTHALDDRFRLVRTEPCNGGDCGDRSLWWPRSEVPAPYGVGWTSSPPDDVVRSEDGDTVILEHRGQRYHYSPGRMAPDRIVPFGDTDSSGFRLLAYTVRGALGYADPWLPIPVPLANETHSFDVHPGEDQDFLGRGWTTVDAFAHLQADPEAGAILADGGCVFRYAVHAFRSDSASGVPNPVLATGDVLIDVSLLSRDGQPTAWSFMHQSDLPPRPWFSDPQREDPSGPVSSDRTCKDIDKGPAPRMSLPEAWGQTGQLVRQPSNRSFTVEVLRHDQSQMEDVPGLFAQFSFGPLDGNGHGSTVVWDLERGSVVVAQLAEDDATGPP